jgi:hypothetical protein
MFCCHVFWFELPDVVSLSDRTVAGAAVLGPRLAII